MLITHSLFEQLCKSREGFATFRPEVQSTTLHATFYTDNQTNLMRQEELTDLIKLYNSTDHKVWTTEKTIKQSSRINFNLSSQFKSAISSISGMSYELGFLVFQPFIGE